MTRAGGAVAEAARLLDGLAQRDVPLGPLTTYRVGGPAAVFVEASSVDDLRRVAGAVAATGLPTLVVGKGSNLLVADAGFPGVAVVLGPAFAEIAIDGTRVEAGGAAALPVAARRTVRAGLSGFEWAVGVPGSIGGAVRMNAGGHGSDMAASLIEARVVDLRHAGSTTRSCRWHGSSSATGGRPSRPTTWSWPPPSGCGRETGRRGSGRSPRSWPGGAPTSLAARTPGRCSSTRWTTRQAG